jgi:hypothetical protein
MAASAERSLPALRRPQRRDPAVATGPRVSRSDLLLVGLLIGIATWIYSIYALRVGSFQSDEQQYMQLARYISHTFPKSLWQSGIYPRGTQRLDPIILSIPFALLRDPGTLQLAHVIQCLLFASTALPVFLMASRAGLPRAASLLAATLSIVVPWAVVSTSFLTESLAYPAFAWVLYTTWSVLVRPSPGRELLAILALVLAALSRTGLLAMVPMLPLAIVWHEWSWELAGRPWRSRARALPRSLWTRYRLLSVVVVLALLVYAADKLGLLPGRGLASLAGEYGVPHVEALSSLLARYREYLSRIAAGTGFLALALALPWTVVMLLRPRDGARHALAVVCTLGLGTILLSLLKGGPDERYILYGAAPVSLGAAAALADSVRRRSRPGVGAGFGVFAGILVVVLLIDSVNWPQAVNTYDFFTYPAAMFYRRVILGHIGGIGALGPDRLVEIGLLVTAVLWMASRHRAWALRPAAILAGVGILALCAVQVSYAMRKFTTTAGESNGATAAERSWVDRYVPSGANVGRLAVSMGEVDYSAIWSATTFWNTSVDSDVYTTPVDPLPEFLWDYPYRIAPAPRTGLLTVYDSLGQAVPARTLDYLLVPLQGSNRIAIDAKPLLQDPYLPLTLVKVRQPARLDWSLSGTSPEAFVTSGQPATATVYEGALEGAGPHCAQFVLISPPNFTGRWPYTVTVAGGATRHGSLTAEQTIAMKVALPANVAERAKPAVTVLVRGQAPYVNGAIVSARFANFAVVPCRGTSGH